MSKGLIPTHPKDREKAVRFIEYAAVCFEVTRYASPENLMDDEAQHTASLKIFMFLALGALYSSIPVMQNAFWRKKQELEYSRQELTQGDALKLPAYHVYLSQQVNSYRGVEAQTVSKDVETMREFISETNLEEGACFGEAIRTLVESNRAFYS